MSFEHFEKLGRCASSEDLETWAWRILQQMETTDDPKRVYELDGFLESLLLGSPQVASDLRAGTMLERIKEVVDPDKRRDLRRSLSNLLVKIAPHVSLDAKHALRQTIIEMIGAAP